MRPLPAQHETARPSVASVLVIQPDEQVPLGRFSDWLTQSGVDVTVIRPYTGDPIPSELDSDGLIVLGGTMTAHDLEQFPWLADIQALYHQAHQVNAPTLGVCLGAQLLAVAFDGEVTSNAPSGPEIGVVDIEWTADGHNDAIARQLPQSFPMTSFHYDAISRLPAGAVLLGRGARYPHQVFRFGNAIGVQFHPEATPELFRKWCAADVVQEPELSQFFHDAMGHVERADEQIATHAELLARNFVSALHAVPRLELS
ncbi:MAG TPA: type 1 glutamine amidotransferase [Enteractinococcus sp.]